MRTAAGAPQPIPSCLRHSAKPRPYSAPTMKAPFFKPGIITTHGAFESRSCGIPLSGVRMISEKTSAESARRSFALPAAKDDVAIRNDAAIAIPFIGDLRALHVHATGQATTDKFVTILFTPKHSQTHCERSRRAA